MIKEKTQKSLLTKRDVKEAEGGTEIYNRSVNSDLKGRLDNGTGYYGPSDELIGNYDKAYYKNVKDKVFLLDVAQIQKVADNFIENWLGYYGGQLQEYFLRTPDGQQEDLIARVWCWANYHVGTTEPTIGFSGPHFAEGIRPAFYLNMQKATIAAGNGTETQPYILKVSDSSAASNVASIKVVIDGKHVSFNNDLGYPFVDNANRTQVPLRVTMETYGAAVNWNAATKTAIVEKDGVIVKIPVGQKHIFVNDKIQAIDTVAQIVNGRTYLPIRPVVEALAGQVAWDQNTKSVIINSL